MRQRGSWILVGLLFFPLPVKIHAEPTPGLTLTDLLSHMQDRQKSLHDLTFEFSEVLKSPIGSADHIQGKVSFKKPYHLRVDQQSPEKQTLWSDGNRMWLYTPANQQELDGAWKSWIDQTGFPAPLLNFVSDMPAEQWSLRYQILFGGYDQHVYQVTFKPRHPDDSPITLWVSDDSFLPVRGQLDAPAGRINVTFSHVRSDSGLADSLFNPTVPDGTVKVPLPS